MQPTSEQNQAQFSRPRRRFWTRRVLVLLGANAAAIVLVLCCAFVVYAAFGHPWDEGERIRELPHGYYLYQTPDAILLCHDPSATLHVPSVNEATIDSVAVEGDLVFGHTLPRPGGIPGTPSGYFLFDTKTGMVREGLTDTDWRAALAQSGVANPHVAPPTALPP